MQNKSINCLKFLEIKAWRAFAENMQIKCKLQFKHDCTMNMFEKVTNCIFCLLCLSNINFMVENRKKTSKN